MAKLNPYLFFNGNCEEAFDFYKSVFRKDFRMSRYKDVPQTDRQIFQEEDNKVMHVSLPVSAETTLMGADMPGFSAPPSSAHPFALFITADSKAEAGRLFNELSTGGQVQMPMTETFWGAYYGFVTDKFGVNWKISFDISAG